jgi:nanoRNase/pAp phosphatase (c-di-AMP/oligoRNAs hydrolase)
MNMSLNENQQIIELIKKSNNILITTKGEFSIDAVAAGLGLISVFKKMNKPADIVIDDFKIPKNLAFLPQIKIIEPRIYNLRRFIIKLDISHSQVDEISYDVHENHLDFIISPRNGFFNEKDISTSSSGFKYDLIVTLDTPDLESLGDVYNNDTEFFYNTPIINIDHNPNNENFGQINRVDLTATSVSEIVYSWIRESWGKEFINEEAVTCFLTGMIAKTRSFKTPAVTPRALEMVGELVAFGARREEIIKNLYRSRSLNTLKLWGSILARLKDDVADGIVWSYLTREDFKDLSTEEEDVAGVIDELIVNAPEAKVIVLFYEKELEKICCLIACDPSINALSLSRSFEVKGSKNIVRFCLDKMNIEQAEKVVLDQVKKALAEIRIK